MKKIRTILVDDEPLALQSLEALLRNYCPNVEVIGSCELMSDAILQINQKKPDLLILDIQLKKGTSFELLKSLTQLDFEIIFITAFSQYAIKAIKFNALDYLLKPLDVDEIKEAIQRVKNRLSKSKPNNSLKTFLQNNEKNKAQKRITLPTNDTLEFVEIQDIIRCRADGAYTEFYTRNGKIVVSKNLKMYEDLLSDFGFYRPHQSYLINRVYITKFIKSDGGFIIMSDGEKIPVSKRRRKSFIEWINGDDISNDIQFSE